MRTGVRDAALAVCVILAVCGASFGAEKATPPEQPKTGPGGAEYAHAKMKETEFGEGGTKAWVFEPSEPSPEKAPVIVFLHGWGHWGPVTYKQWIEHLVRRGNIVIHPKYQANLVTLPSKMTENAKAGIKAALDELRKEGHVKPDETRLAIAGHSLGAVLAANIAATAKDGGLPQPLAVLCVQPGDPSETAISDRLRKNFDLEFRSILADCSKIPKGTLVLIVVGDSDRVVGDATAKLIWAQVQHLPGKDRDYVTLVSDAHGSPALKALHVAPAAPRKHSIVDLTKAGTDALDYYGTWKLLDGLTDAAFYGRNREYALGNTPEQRFMGKWSDGVPVKELKVLEKEVAEGVKK